MDKTNPNAADSFVALPCHEEVAVLFADSHIMVIDKPSGLLSLSGKNPLNKDSVHFRLVQDYPSVTMVHRLDLGTSGLMVLALNKEVNAHLTKQFQARSVVKTYDAMLLGHLMDDEGVIDASIARAEFPYMKVCRETGKKAQSHYRVLARLQNSSTGVKTTRVRFTPLTGRTHQLRVHSLAMGNPIVGCDLYKSIVAGVDSQSLANRLMLHARSLEFEHPVTGERLYFECSADRLFEIT